MVNNIVPNEVLVIGHWAGPVVGSSEGNAYMEAVWQEGKAFLDFRFKEENQKVICLQGYLNNCIVNTYEKIFIELYEENNLEMEKLKVKIFFQFINKNELVGNWEASNKAKGTVQLFRNKHNFYQTNQFEIFDIITKNYNFYDVRVYKNDVDQILRYLKNLSLPNGTLWVTEQYKNGLSKTTKGELYLEYKDRSDELDGLIIGANKTIDDTMSSINLNLRRQEISTLTVTSSDVFWSTSMPMVIKEIVETRTNKLLLLYKKYGLNINFIVFLALLVWMPGQNLDRRISAAIFFVCLAFGHLFAHRYFSRSYILPGKTQPNTWKEKYPRLSYILYTIGTIIGSYGITYALKTIGQQILLLLQINNN